jgi:hypothetical protein
VSKFNPFRPNHIVHPGMFAGRYEEMVALERALFQTMNGNPAHFLIEGERGIGKSSVLLNISWVATGQLDPFEIQNKFNFITVSTSLDDRHGFADIVQTIALELRRQIAAREPAQELAKTTWDFLKKWEVAGVRFKDENKREAKESELVEDLSFALAQSLERLGNAVDGVLILMDEADKPPVSSHLGALLKQLTERLTIRNCDRVCIGLAGLTAAREKLRQSHESSLRLFNIFSLEPLSSQDTFKVIRLGLEEAKRNNGVEVTITDDGKQLLSFFTQGYPHFIQQFAYCAFEVDDDNEIDEDDVWKGAYKENGALKQLGLKYFEKQYFDQIGSDEYRQILRVMGEHMDRWVTKAEIRKEAVGIKAYTLDNALAALKTRRIILPKPGSKGTYRLPSRSFAVWIRACLLKNSFLGVRGRKCSPVSG